MATSAASTVTILSTKEETVTHPQNVTLVLRKPKTSKKIQWTEETVDNEGMGKKKSKCCCIYTKPKMFGESSSDESDSSGDETDHCKGHKGKCYQHSGGGANNDDANGGQGTKGNNSI